MSETNGNGYHHEGNGAIATIPKADRLPPQNIEAEQSVLGSIILDETVLLEVMELGLGVWHFYLDKHQIIYQAIIDAFERNGPIDFVTLAEELRRQGQFEKIGGHEGLREIVDAVPTSANAVYYAGIVMEKAQRRRMVDASREVMDAAHNGQLTAPQLYELMERQMIAVEIEVPEDELSVNPLPDRMGRAAFAGLAGEIVAIINPQTEACPEAILGQFLVAFGSAAGPRPHWQVGGTKHRCNLFLCLVGNTGMSRKGTSLDAAQWLLSRADESLALRPKLNNMTSGEGLIQFCKDHPGPSLAEETEFSGMLTRMGRQGNTLSAVLRMAWDGPRLSVPVRKDPIHINDSYVSLIGHTTLSDLKTMLGQNDIDNGLVNRHLWMHVYADGILPDGGDFGGILDALAPYSLRVSDALNFAKTNRGLDVPFLKTPGAKELWEHLYRGQLREPRAGDWGKATVRAAPNILRLAVIYAVLDQCFYIDLCHLEAALAFWNYCDQTAAHLFGNPRVDGNLAKLLDYLACTPRWVTRNEIRQRAFKGHLKTAEAERLLSLAQGSGLVVYRVTKTSGRDRHEWMLRSHTP